MIMWESSCMRAPCGRCNPAHQSEGSVPGHLAALALHLWDAGGPAEASAVCTWHTLCRLQGCVNVHSLSSGESSAQQGRGQGLRRRNSTS